MFQLFFCMYVCFNICVTQLSVWKVSGTLILPWICKTSITYDIPTFPITIIPDLTKVLITQLSINFLQVSHVHFDNKSLSYQHKVFQKV
jgi:hypothetical protein